MGASKDLTPSGAETLEDIQSVKERKKAVHYSPPPFKFNPDLNGKRDLTRFLMAPEKTALLVVDVQNLFTEPGAPFAASDGPEIVPNINKLADYCRKNDIPVIWIQLTNRKDGSDLGMMGKYWHFLDLTSWLGRDTHFWKFYSELDNKPDDIYVTKTKHNAFWGSDLEVVLRGLEVESLIFTGICTDFCVGITLIDAFHRDFNPILVMDATTTFTPYKQEWMTKIEAYWGRVLTTDEVIIELKA